MLHSDPAKPFATRAALRSFLLAAATAYAPIAGAATLYWDGTDSTANADGGAGTWDATATNWDTLATAGANSAWVDGSDAVFGGATGTVTVSGSFSLNSLTIGNGVSYTLTGGTLTLGGKTITTSGAGNSVDVFINSVLAGTGGITLAANGDTSASGGGVGGSLKLGGANTFTGGVTITSGVVNLDSNFGDSANVITLNGGGLVDENTSTTFARSIVVGASGGVIRSWTSTPTFTGGISGTGTLRRTDTGTQTYTGDFSGSVGFNNQAGTSILRGNWLSTGALTVSAGTVTLSGQVYDGAAISNSGALAFNAFNRNSRTLAGTVGLGRQAALGTGSTYAITSGTTIMASTGALLDASRFAAGYVLTRSAVNSPTLLGSTAINLAGASSAIRDPFYTGTYTLTGALTMAAGGLGGFYAPSAAMNVNGQTIDVWGGPLWVGSLSGSGTITANGPGRTDTGRTGNFPALWLVGSVSQSKAGAILGRLGDASVVVGSDNTSTTYSGGFNNGSWSGAPASLLKVGTGTLTLTGGGTASGGIVVEQGTLVINRSGVGFNAGAYNGSAVYAVLKGATLSINGDWNTANANTLLVQGGTASFVSTLNYLNNIILDGGTLGGSAGARVGYHAGDAYINVLSGLGASTISKINLLDDSAARRTLYVRVQDGSAARDLLVSGGLNDDSGFPGLRINKSGLGTMALTASSVRSGGTTLTGGTLEVAAATALGSGASAGVTLTGGTLAIKYDLGGTQSSMAYALGGGTLLLSGNTTAVTQAIGAVTINNGTTMLTASPGAGGTTTVNLGSITRSGSATQALLNLNGTATWTTTQANDATKGRLLGVLLNGGFAMNNGSNTVVAYTGTQISGTTISAGATTDYTIGASVTGDLSMAAAGTTTVQSLTLDSAAGRTVNIGAGNILRVVDGLFQKTSGVAFNFGATGTLTAGSADNTAADLLISATGGMAAGTGMTVASVIANNGTGAVTLVKSGVGDLNLTSGANTYTGGTLISQGRLRVSGDAAIGGASGGAITVNDGGQLWATGSISKAITLNGGSGAYEAAGYLGAIRIETGVTLSGALTVNNDSQVTTYGSSSATISGALTLNGTLVKTGAGTLTLSAGNSGNGTLYVKEGTVSLTGDYVNKNVDIFIGQGATVSNVGINAFQGGLLTVAGGTYTTSSYHGKFRNVNLYGGAIVGTGSGKYNGEDGGFVDDANTVFVGGSAYSRIDTPNKIALNNTRFYVQDATGNAAPDLVVRGSLAGTGYLGGRGTTRFALQPLSQSTNANHTANLYVAPGHTLEVAVNGAMGTGTITMDGGTLRMTSLAGLAEYNISSTSMDTASTGTFKGITVDNQYHNTNNSTAFGGNTTWSYRGQLVIGGSSSRVINFAENIDDAVWMRITGGPSNISTVVLNDGGWNTTTYGSITLAPGTYSIDLRAWNGGGGAGWVSGLNGNGLAWDITTGAANTNSSSTAWTSVGAVAAGVDPNIQLWATGGISQTLSNSIVLNSLSMVDVAAAGDSVTLSGVVSGGGMLWKTGSGVLVLSGANTNSGGITVGAGTLRIDAASRLGTGALNLLDGSTLDYTGTGAATVSNVVQLDRGNATVSVGSATGSLTLAQGVDNYVTSDPVRTLTKTGSGALTIAGVTTGKHLYALSAGTLNITATDASLASANVAAGTLSVTSTTFGAITNAATATATSTTLGALTNTAGTLTANSATTIGNVTVSGGTLSATAATTAGTISVSGGTATLGAGGYGATTLSNGTLNLGAATLASVTKTGGTLNIGAVGTAATLAVSANSAFGGMLNFDLSNSIASGNDLITVAGTADLTGLTGVTFNLTSGLLTTGSYTLISATGVTGPSIGIASVTKAGIASGASRQTYTLSTSTLANKLTLDVAGTVGTNTFANGGNDVWSTNSTDGAWTSTATDQWFYNGDLVTFADLAGVTAKTVTVSGSVAPGSLAFTNTAAGTAFTLSGTGKITGTTGLTKSGNGRLVLSNTGGNDFTGATNVSNGTLEVGAANALSAASVITVNGGTLDVAAVANAAAGTVTLSSGSITGTTGSLNAAALTVNGGTLAANVAGTGTLTFAGTNLTYANTATHTGGTTLGSGSLTVAAGGSIAGAFTQSANTTLTVAGTLGGALGVATGATTTVATGGSVGGNVTLAGNATLSNSGTITGSLSLASTSSATNAGTISGGFTLANTASLTSTGSIAGGGTIVSGTSLNTSGTLAGNISNAGTLTFSGSTDRSYAGVISGGGSVVKTGSGTQTLSGTAHAIGSIALQQGRLVLNTGSGSTWNNTVGTASITMSNGTVLQAVNSTSLNGNITIVGDASIQVDSGSTVWKDTSGSLGYATTNATFRKTGAGTLVIATNRLAFGTGSTVVVDGGTLQLNMNIWGGGSIMGSAGLTVNSGGTVSITGYHVFDAYSGFVPVVNGGTITGNGQDVYIGGFNMTGGLVERSRFVSVSSITTNAASTTAVYAANLSSGATTISVADGSAAVDFRLDPYWNGTTNGTAITKTGAGLMQVALAASGTIALNAGTVQVGAGGTAGTVGNVTAAAGTLLSFNRSDSYNHSATIAGAGAVEQVGAGTLTLSAANSFSGGLTINGGTVALTNATAGGTAGITASNNATLDVATGITAAHTTLAGAGSLTKSGSGALTLTGSNSLSGNLSVTGGTLSLVGSGSLGNGGTVSVAGGATLALGASVNDTQTGLITNAGTLTNSGTTARGVSNSGTFTNSGVAGTLTLTTGTVTNTGTLGAVTHVNGTLNSTGTVGAITSTAGNLNLSGTAGGITLGGATVLNVGGRASTGSLGAASLTVVDGSSLEFELSDANNSQFYDRLTLSGALDISQVANPVTLYLYSFDRVAGLRGNATVFNRYADFALDIITAGSVVGSTEIGDPLGGSFLPVLNLDVQNFTYLVDGVSTQANANDWSLVATANGYSLRYTADIQRIEINVGDGLDQVLLDSAAGQGFLGDLAANELGRVLRKTGPGRLAVSDVLTHVGGTQVEGGLLALLSGGSLGSGDVTIFSGATLELATSGTFANTISGAGDIRKTGLDSLELTGTLAITGNVSVQEGSLVANFAALTGNLEILSGATAEFKGASGQTFAGRLSGAGTARLASGNTLTLGASSNGFSGLFSVANGTLVLAADNALGSGVADVALGSTLTLSGGITAASSVTGAGSLTKVGSGLATLSGAIAHTGSTTVSAGTLKGDFTNATGAISVASGAGLEYAISADATRAGADITGAGSLTKSGNGKLTLSSALGVSGGVAVTGGTLAAPGFGSNSIAISSGATAELNLAASANLGNVVSGAGTFTKTGNSTLTVGSTGLSTFAGKLRVAQGTVSTAAVANLGTSSAAIELDGGALAITATGQTIGTTRAITIGASGATLNIASLGQTGTLTVDAAISGSGPVTLAGSGNTSASGGGDSGNGIRLTNGANSFVGDVTITSGLVSYNANAVFGNSANRIILNGGGLLDANDNVALSRNIEVQSGGGFVRTWGNVNATWSGSLSGTGALNRTDAGTLTHAGDLSGFTGTFNNQAATTLFTGSSAAFGAATVNVSAGTVGFATNRVGSAAVKLAGGTLRFESAGTVSGGSVQLVSGSAGYVSTNGYDVVLANGITGTGSSLDKNGNGTLTLQGSGTATITGAINAYAGTLAVAGQTVGSSTAWIDGGTVKVSSGSLTASSSILIGNGTLEITGGTVSTDFFRTSDGYYNKNSTVNQSGGTFNVTGSTIQNERSNSFMFNHWSGTSTYNLSGGTLNVLNTQVNMGWDGNAYINQTGGTANLKGINMNDGRTNSAAYNLTGGRLNVGSLGITAATNKTVTLGTATVGALADWTGASAMTLNAGTTVTFDTADAASPATARTITLSGALSGSGSLAKTGNGTLTLSANNSLTGALSATGGTLNINGTNQGASAVSVSNGATVSFNVNNSLSAGHGSAVAAALTANGGTFVFGSGTEMRVGNINLNGGTLTSNRGLSSWDVLLANVASGAATVTVTGTSASTINGTGGLHIQGVQNFSVDDVTGDAAADLVISAQLGDGGVYAGGAGGINKTGSGTLSLSHSANSFTGGITIGAGTVSVDGAGRLNSGSYAGAIANSGALAFTSSANQTLSGVVSGTGSLTKSGNGTLTLSAANSFSGGTTIAGGTLQLGVNNALNATAAVALNSGTLGLGSTAQTIGALSVASGSVTGTGSLSATSLSVTTSLTGTGVVNASAYSLADGATLGAGLTLGGSASLTKSSNGTLTVGSTLANSGGVSVSAGSLVLASANSFTGGATVTGGTLTASANGALSNGAVTVNGGTLDIGSTTQSVGAFALTGGQLVGAGTLNASSVSISGGTLGGTLATTGTASLSGGVLNGTLNAGTLAFGAGTVSGSGVLNAAAYSFADGAVVGSGLTLGGNGTLTQSTNGTLTLDATLSNGGGVLVTAGTLVLAGPNNFTGGVDVSGGVLRTSLDGALSGGSVTVSSGTLDIGTTSQSVVALSMTGGSIVGAGTLVAESVSISGGVLSGSISTGWTATLSGGTIDGLVDAGTLSINSGSVGGTGSLTAYVYDLGGDATLGAGLSLGGSASLMKASEGTLAIHSNLANTGGVMVSAGTLLLSGANTYTGGTTVNGGTLQVGGNAVLGDTASGLALNGGTLSSDSTAARVITLTGASTIGGDITLGDATRNGALTLAADFDLGGADRTVTAASAVTLSGTLANGALTKAGNGTLTLSGANTYAAGTTVNAGKLTAASDGALSTGPVTVNGGTLDIGSTSQSVSDLAVAGGTLAGAGSLAAASVNVSGGTIAGNVTTDGAATFTGGVVTGTVNAGTLVIDSVSPTGTGSLNAGTYAFGDNATLAAGLTLGGTAALTKSTEGMLTVGSNLANTGGVSVSAGTLVLAGAANHTGGTVITGGTLVVGGSGSLGSGSYAGDIANDGALVFATSSNQTLSGAVTGTGGLYKLGTGTLTLSGASTYTGETNVTGGRLVLAREDAISADSAVTIGAGGTLALSYALGSDSPISRVFLGNGTLDLALTGFTSTLTGLADFGGSLRLLAGTVFDSSASGWNGSVIFAGGSLAPAALADYNGVITLAAGATLSAADPLPKNIVLEAGATIDFSGASAAALNSTIQFAGGTLANAENFTGTLVVTGSGVNITAGSLGNGTLVVGAGSSVNLTEAIQNTINVSGGSITGGANIAGTLLLTDGTFTIGATGGAPGIDTLGAGATLSLGGGTLDLNGSSIASTIEFTGGSLANAQNFTGTVAVQSGVTLENTGTLGGTIQVASGATVANTGELTGTVAVTGGSLVNSGTVSGQLNVGTGGNLTNQGDLTGTVAVTGGSLVNAGTVSGQLQVASGATVANTGTVTGDVTVTGGGLVNNGTVTGDVTVQSGGTLSGNGTFAGTTIQQGGVLSPGSSPGLQTYTSDLILTRGSIWTEQIYSEQAVLTNGDAQGNHVGARGYDTLVFTNGATLDLRDASSANQITLRLMTLANWSDSDPGIPSVANLFFEKDGSGNWIQKDFVLATYGTRALLADGESISSVFAIDINGFYYASGVNAASIPASMRPWGDSFWVFERDLGNGTYQLTLAAVPEPSTYGIILGGLALAAAAYRRRRQAKV